MQISSPSGNEQLFSPDFLPPSPDSLPMQEKNDGKGRMLQICASTLPFLFFSRMRRWRKILSHSPIHYDPSRGKDNSILSKAANEK
jgi:hypothetical protein